MSWTRIWGVMLRYIYFFARMDHLVDLCFWPLLDLFVWGITSTWIQSQEPSAGPLALAILTGLVFWQLVWRGTYEISVNLLQEFWSRNMVNLFSSPLKVSEWVTALMILGVGKLCFALGFGALIVWGLYSLNVFTIGWALIPFAFSLLLSGWCMGFLSAAIIVYWGQRLQMLAWVTGYIFVPFAAVYYPVSALPCWAQSLAHALPMSYIFEGMRHILNGGTFPWSDWLTSLALNGFYLVIILILFAKFFSKSRNKGLARLE
jgi:ABC-2 type transport system permease protein